jgi:hypothetical protein
MIIITAKKDGFRRCGVAHSAKRVEYPADAFSPEQLAELQAEPMLVVELVIDAPKDPGQTAPLDAEIVAEPVVAETTAPAAEDHLVETAEARPAPKTRAASKKGGEKAPRE